MDMTHLENNIEFEIYILKYKTGLNHCLIRDNKKNISWLASFVCGYLK